MPEEQKVQKTHKIDPKLYGELGVSLKEIYGEAAIERTKKEITHRGYDTTGYGYQFCVNRLNEVLPKYGLTWATQDSIKLIREYPVKSGAIYYEYAGRLSLMFLDEANNVVDRKDCYGGHQSSTHADAMKGAFTNAFKKAVALVGVGADAYEGTIDEDFRPIEEPAKGPVTDAFAVKLTDEEMKQVEKHIMIITGAQSKEELDKIDKAITNLIGKATGKQVAYLRKLSEKRKGEL